MDEQLEFVRQIATRLGSADIDYMVTGSIAMAVYATPRMTRDVDVVVDCTKRDVDTLVDLFSHDCYVERSAVAEAIEMKSMFNIIHNEWIIKGDFIVRKDEPYRQAEFVRRRQIDVDGTPVTVTAPEDLVLSKLVWAQETGSELQQRDVHAILGAGLEMDGDYLRMWAERLGVGQLLTEIQP